MLILEKFTCPGIEKKQRDLFAALLSHQHVDTS